MKMAWAQAIYFYPDVVHRVKILPVNRLYTRVFSHLSYFSLGGGRALRFIFKFNFNLTILLNLLTSFLDDNIKSNVAFRKISRHKISVTQNSMSVL